MEVVKISSGFGNQLFQYVFALYLKKQGYKNVCLDKSAFKYRSSNRTCGIDLISELPTIEDKRIFYWYQSFGYNIAKALFRLNPFVKLVTDKTLKLPVNGTFIYFDGFWQTDAYINQLGDWDAWCHPKEPMPETIAQFANSIQKEYAISMHVRRGDYFSDEFIRRYGVCQADYYQKAITQLTQDLSTYTLYLFSDDPEWVRANIKLPDNSVFVENINIHPFWHIWLMSRCRDHIISNSTFSWWGAYMGQHPQKRVVAPKTWMIGSKETLALPEWIKL